MNNKIAIVVDDHWIARQAISRVISEIRPDLITVEAETGDEALKAVTRYDEIELIVLDLFIPECGPWEILRAVKKTHPNVPIVIMSMSEDREHVLQALDEGAVGYIPKSASPEKIISTIRRVMAGDVALPQNLLRNAAPTNNTSMTDDTELGRLAASVDNMTPRQQQVFTLLADDASNGNIAEELGLSVNTVRVHLQAISTKLGRRQRREIVHLANRWRTRSDAA